jgi:hypothetical protein
MAGDAGPRTVPHGKLRARLMRLATRAFDALPAEAALNPAGRLAHRRAR